MFLEIAEDDVQSVARFFRRVGRNDYADILDPPQPTENTRLALAKAIFLTDLQYRTLTGSWDTLGPRIQESYMVAAQTALNFTAGKIKTQQTDETESSDKAFDNIKNTVILSLVGTIEGWRDGQ